MLLANFSTKSGYSVTLNLRLFRIADVLCLLTYPFHWFKEVEGQGHALHSLVSLALSEKKIKLMPRLYLTSEQSER